MRKKQLIKINEALKRQNTASLQLRETLEKDGTRYQDLLIQGEYHSFFDDYSRREVCLNDAVGNRVTLGFLIHIFEKMPKFTKDDEVQSEYILPATRAALKTLNLKPKFILMGLNAIISGWSLVKWQPQMTDDQLSGLGCKIFGYEECHPRQWIRFHAPERVNLISHYRAIYIPRPAGMEARYSSLSQEKFILRPNDPTFQHLTRVDRNQGYGFSRIQPIWDAITKLRERSDSDHFLKSNFMEARYPASWEATGKATKFIDKVRKANRRKGIAIEAVTNPTDNSDTGLPSVQYRPWGQGPQGQPMDRNQASAYLDGEWLRLLVNLGYSQIWATGGNAGALEGSEINLTKDDRADIAEFSILAPMYKEVLKRLAELGIMAAVGVPEEEISILLSKEYEMIPWLTWEFNDKAALQQEQMEHQLEMERGGSDERNKYDRENEEKENSKSLSEWISCCTRKHGPKGDGTMTHKQCVAAAYKKFGKSNDISWAHNERVHDQFIFCMRNNLAMPMTPVTSSWLRRIGFEDEMMYMETHEGYRYKKPRGDAEQQYFAWTDSGSKGGYYWDEFADRNPPWERITSFPTQLEGQYGEGVFGTPEETRAFKMEGSEELGIIGAGKTREPYRIAPQPEGMTSTALKIPTETMESAYDWEKEEKFPYIAKHKGKTLKNPKGAGRKSKPGRKPKGSYLESQPYQEPYYNPYQNKKFKEILNSQSALSRFAKGISTDHNPGGWSMKPATTYKIKELVGELIKSSFRTNRVSFGNSIKAGHPYNYGGEDEFICPQSYKTNIGRKVPLGIYHNLETPGDINLPEWQIIGTHEVLGWDDELGQEIAKNEYDVEKVNAFFEKTGGENWIKPYLDAGEEPPISGAYSCRVITYNSKNFQVDIELMSMSFVPDANCPWDICNFKPEVKT